MKIIKINNLATGTWQRDCELTYIAQQLSDFQLEFKKDSDSQRWRVLFKNTISYKVTAEEFIEFDILSKMPNDGSFFEIQDSNFIKKIIGKENLLKLKHYIFCFYDEFIEVIAEDLTFEIILSSSTN